ncbi:MAG: SAM-dependent methyltransferase, partial [Alphaproteobacteria bacterium]
LSVIFPNGTTRLFGRPGTSPFVEIKFSNWRGFRKVATGGELGFAEAYMSEDLDISDLYALFQLILSNRGLNLDRDNPIDGASLRYFISWLKHKFRPNSKRGSKKNISAHYDLGNEFYELWLDESMTYSSALYAGNTDLSLQTAQDQKYASIIQRGGFTSDSHVLEIGCGWGGFAEYAAKNAGCNVTGITISQEQFDFAKERIQREGLNEKVELRMQDYRDVESSAFDGVASIEMFEAVGEKYWPVYFDKVKDVLKPGAKASLQIITIDDREFELYRKSTDFIQTYIFPGGMLPSVEVLNK